MFRLPKFVGIDPFSDGGLTLLSHSSGIEKCIEMPTAGSQIDLEVLTQYLTSIKEQVNGELEVGVNKINQKLCHDNFILKKATKNDEVIKVICDSLGINSCLINPSEWMRPFYRNSWNTSISAKDERNCRHMKTALFLMFNKSFPNQPLELSRMHYGIINSLLVARCIWSKHRRIARRKLNLYNEIEEIK